MAIFISRSPFEESKICPSDTPRAEEIEQMLLDVGFDLSAFEKLYGKEKIRNSIRLGKDLKDRYSVLWLYNALVFPEKEEKDR